MRKQLEDLRKRMSEENIDAYIIPTTDFHGSEYVNDYFKCREFVSGFTGSAGTLAVTETEAALWTDGRYFLQAEAELAGSQIQLMREGEPGVPGIADWLAQRLSPGKAAEKITENCAQPEANLRNVDGENLGDATVGFDGRVVSAKMGAELARIFRIEHELDLVGEIWPDRPALCGSELYALPGVRRRESPASKLSRLRCELQRAGAESHLITSLEEIAWLFDLRARDVMHTPVFYAFALIEQERARVYLLNQDKEALGLFGRGVETRPYMAIFGDLKALECGSIMLDESSVSYGLSEAIPIGLTRINRQDPAMQMKAIKSPAEIASTRGAHLRDGAAMMRFISWLKENVGKHEITEMSAAERLWEERKKEGAYDLSFDTIAAYGAHGAIIHYEASPATNVKLKPAGFLLVDSGGQYEDGTTDITRTIALGELTEEMKRCYTAVLKAHIALATAVFDSLTTGADLDRLARRQIQAIGYDYKHGTGHGVGHMLSVHEGPASISPRGANTHVLPGMIMSNEPGIYIENEFGIRLENELLCVDLGNGKYGFETISFCPFEEEAILPEMLTDREKAWLNEYHANVYRKVELKGQISAYLLA